MLYARFGAGAFPARAIALHAGHKKFDTTMGYVQTTNAFRDHAGKKIL